jgi:hypothetical protein
MMHGRHLGMGRRETAGFLLFSATSAEEQNMPALVGDIDHTDTYDIWVILLPFSVQLAPGAHVGYVPSWPHSFDIAAGGSVVLGVHLGLSPGEMLDFALGFIGLDVARDDPGARERETPPASRDLPPLMILPPRKLPILLRSDELRFHESGAGATIR